MISSIRAWLNDLGVGQYADAFADNHIDLELLSNLTDAVLKDIGVGSAGHRLSILNAIGKLTPCNGSTDSTAVDIRDASSLSTQPERRWPKPKR